MAYRNYVHIARSDIYPCCVVAPVVHVGMHAEATLSGRKKIDYSDLPRAGLCVSCHLDENFGLYFGPPHHRSCPTSDIAHWSALMAASGTDPGRGQHRGHEWCHWRRQQAALRATVSARSEHFAKTLEESHTLAFHVCISRPPRPRRALQRWESANAKQVVSLPAREAVSRQKV